MQTGPDATAVGIRVGDRVGDRVGEAVTATGAGVAATHTVVEIWFTAPLRPLYDVTEKTLVELPAMLLSSDVPTPDPTPIAKRVMPLARAVFAAVPGAVADWPSVSTTNTFEAPLRDALKMLF